MVGSSGCHSLGLKAGLALSVILPPLAMGAVAVRVNLSFLALPSPVTETCCATKRKKREQHSSDKELRCAIVFKRQIKARFAKDARDATASTPGRSPAIRHNSDKMCRACFFLFFRLCANAGKEREEQGYARAGHSPRRKP